MCELLVVSAPNPFALGPILSAATLLEQHGDAGFGWGVAWAPADGEPLQLYKRPAVIAGDPYLESLADERAVAALVHLRRPSDSSTVGMPDTQPFLDAKLGLAFAHNGFLPHYQLWRNHYRHLLAGRADSEVGFAHFRTLLPTLGLEGALRRVVEDIGGPQGIANLAVLEQGGAIHMLCQHRVNRVCLLQDGPLQGFVTSLHKEDEAQVATLFPGATLTLLPLGELHTIPARATNIV